MKQNLLQKGKLLFICFCFLQPLFYPGQTARASEYPVDLNHANQSQESSIVSPSDMISDFDARLAIARILSYNNKNLNEAACEYNILIKENPDNPELLAEAADIEAQLGHASKCRDLYIKALDITNHNQRFLLRFADRMNSWGDFYRSEKIYRNYIKNHSDAQDAILKLASILASSQRYEEAEGIYRKFILQNLETEKVLLDLAKLKLQEKKFNESFLYAGKITMSAPDNTEALFLQGHALVYLKRFEKALNIYEYLATAHSQRASAYLATGKLYIKEEDAEKAAVYFKKAYEIDPENLEVQFYHAGFDRVGSDEFVNNSLKSDAKSPKNLATLAQLYASHGYNKEAIAFYGAAMESDPEYFPAIIGLAEVLAIDKQYDSSIKLFKSLSGKFPDNSKILISTARALGWSRKYVESIDLYEKIHKLNPADPVPQKEKARTAMWGKMYGLAMETYKNMLAPSVDEKLVSILTPISNVLKNKALTGEIEGLQERVREETVYEGYEIFTNNVGDVKKSISPDHKKQIELAAVDLLPLFKIQKAVSLEMKAKDLVWNKRYTQAMDTYEELTCIDPGNEEALFDYAQIECSQGLCDREAGTYKRLLNIDPLHSLAALALKRQEIRSHPFLQLDHSYWNENGRGDLAKITRNRTDLSFDIPFWCRNHAILKIHNWTEHPDFTDESYRANGFSLQLKGIFNPYVKGDVSWTNKNYNDNNFGTTDTGHFSFFFNLKDYVETGIGYVKTDELYNYFGIKQGTRADTWWISAQSNLNRKL
ncbi:MAG: tetratricopeptide repeat protein, partial [Candidatus Celaenobacter polaris]|nr:tetratricopeptide repeat protein [Candidatus Celaenobacter polaris]